jgi:WD40 repeat protein
MRTPKVVKSITAPSNCDSIEVGKDKVFVGMYNYDESSSVRGGGYLLLDRDGDIVVTELNENFGCLDAVWRSDNLVATACSDGYIRTIDSANGAIVETIGLTESPGSAERTDNILMALSDNGTHIAAISAKGQLVILDGSHGEAVMDIPAAHDPVIESWTCALGPKECNLVASGADDCCLKLWDVRSGTNVMTNKRSHQTGVTTVRFMSETELISGSYDERIRRFDIRNIIQPVTEEKSIGGVWRLKPCDDLLFVAACYGGCQVVALDTFKPVCEPHLEHKSMAYGISPINSSRAMSCSFYDHLIQVWQF